LFNCFESVSQVIDDALKSATEAQKKTSKNVDENFKKAINALIDYEKGYGFKSMVAEIMEIAEATDESLIISNKPVRALRASCDLCFVTY
jgi:hypothetical protein